MTKTKRLAPVTLTSEQKEFLENKARTSGYSITTIIKLMIDAEIEKAKKREK